MLSNGLAGLIAKSCVPPTCCEAASVSVRLAVPLKIRFTDPANAASGSENATSTGLLVSELAAGLVNVGAIVMISIA